MNPNNYNLVVVQLNIRSLLSKQLELKRLLRDLEVRKSKADMILFCGGGTAILVGTDMISKKRSDLTVFQIESTFIEVLAKNGRKIVVGSIYRPLNSKEGNFVNEITELICKISKEKSELILGMDHNLDLLKSAEHNMTQNFLNSLLDNDMLPSITRPTRITHNMATLIDNIFVSSKLYMDFESALILNDMPDHLPVLTLLKQTKFTDKTSLEFKSRNLNEAKLSQIQEKPSEINWIASLM